MSILQGPASDAVALGYPPLMRVPFLLLAVLTAVLASEPAASQSAAAPAANPGRLTGRVVTPYGGLLSGAVVTLTSDAASARRWTTVSTSAGEFAFDGIPPGAYALGAAAAGYTFREIAPPARFRSAHALTLADGEQLGGIDLILRRSGSIAGRIVQPDGTPAPGTQVLVALRHEERLSLLPETTAISEWDGRYEMTGLPPGEFLVVVLPPRPNPPPPSTPLPIDVSSAPLTFEPTLYPGVPQSEPGGRVAVYEGVATEGIDVWLTPAPQRFTVSGRVFWPEGLDVENLVIEYGGSPAVRSGVWYVDDPGGLFTLTGLSQGTLVMLARGDSSRGPLIGLSTTDVLLGPVEEVRLDLSQPGSVAGHIVYEQPPPGGAAPRVSLIHALLDVSPLFPTEEAAAGPDGRFRIPHARGAYTFGVLGLPAGWRVRRIQQNGTALPDNRLVVGSGDDVTGVEIAVGPDAEPNP